ncbi:F-box protein [Carex littledalei]|uniref:F-box protein n=1 Tax=Carex littledalei TaxID=544730 RepID=A0A833VQW8_9POAL|nr:F-box protein [Carex littledalei]
MALPSSSKTHKDLPDHLLHHIILPRLPFKFLNRLKCISNMYLLISTDAKFAVDQSRLADASSSGFVLMTPSGLAFYGDPTLIGVPDPSLNFLNPTPHKVKLVSSTNGLLLLYGEFSGKKSLCVCNPAIKEMAFVPYVVPEKYFCCEMGLAYDPCKLPDRYTIVDPLLNYHKDGIIYQFNVFRSDTDKWTNSIQRVYISRGYLAIKAVCVNGVIYWNCGNILLWYDTERDLAGSQTLPMVDGKLIEGIIDVGVYAGEITCCHTWRGGIEVWRLNRGSCSCWDRLHGTSWEDMVDAFDHFDFCHNMQLCSKKRADIFFDRCFICPVGFDGRFVYIAVRLKNQNNTEDLSEKWFGWEIKTGRVEEKWVITSKRHWFHRILKYANSMARVPQILIGAS